MGSSRIVAAFLFSFAVGCFPAHGPRFELETGRQLPDSERVTEYKEEVSTVGLFPLSGYIVYWGRNIPDGYVRPAPWFRFLLAPWMLPMGTMWWNSTLLLAPTISYLMHGCGPNDGLHNQTLAGRCTGEIIVCQCPARSPLCRPRCSP